MASPTSQFGHAIGPLTFDRTKLHRERLVDQIHANLPRKLIVVIAPPGYGKSTLLADFGAHTDLPVCWVRLTEADCDVMRLASVLAASLQKRFRRLRGQPDLAALSGAAPEALARAFVDVIESRISEPFVIALDDLHRVNPSDAVMAFFNAFLQEQPSHVTLLAAGRQLPELSLAKLVVDAEMAGIGPNDLALTSDELRALARKRLGAELPEAETARLLRETQGWISGILLSATMSGTGSEVLAQRTRPMVYEYLAAVVLGHLPDDVYRFTLESSVLPVMTVEGCDCVLQRQDSQRFLARLLRDGLFVVATDQVPRTFEYHPQLRQFLIETLAGKDPKRLRSLRIRAARYLAGHGSPEEAVELYLAAGAPRRAAALAEREAPAMFERGRTQTLEVWGSRLDEAGVAAPGLFLYLATTYADQANLDKADEAAGKAFDMLRRGKSNPAMWARAWTVRGLIALQRGRNEEVIQAAGEAERLLPRSGNLARRATCLRLKGRAIYASGGDVQEAERLILRAVRLLERANDRFTLALVLNDLLPIQSALGKPLEVQAANLRAHEILAQIGSPFPLAISFNNLAMTAYLEGRYDHALRMFEEGLECAHRAANLRLEASILFGQADLFCDLGLPFQTAALYEQGLRLAARLGSVDLLRYGYTQTSVLHRRCGTGTLPHEWLERARALDSAKERPAAVDIQLAALSIAASPSSATLRLMEILRQKQGGLRASEKALILYFLAQAALATGNREEARGHLEEALAWARSHGVEQFLGGEMMYHEGMREFARQDFEGSPHLAVVLQRVDIMRAMARMYEEKSEMPSKKRHLLVKAFGPSELRFEGRRVSDLEPLPKQVLFFLTDRKEVERDVLLETFWLESPPGRQVSSLYTAIHSLRRALSKDMIRIEGSVYAVNPEYAIEYDVAEFEHASSVAMAMPPGDPRRFFALTEAVNVCGGSFLPEYASEWVVERRRQLEGDFLQLLTHHADEALARGQPQQAVNSFRQALQIDPLRDDLNLHYLEVLGQLGRRSEAVGHYRQYVHRLADELGLDPPEPLREAYARLIR